MHFSHSKGHNPGRGSNHVRVTFSDADSNICCEEMLTATELSEWLIDFE